jgi:hypothetical protein
MKYVLAIRKMKAYKFVKTNRNNGYFFIQITVSRYYINQYEILK